LFFLCVDVDDANNGNKMEKNGNMKWHSIEVKHLSFFLFCVFRRTNVALVICCCFTNGKNAQICISIGLCIYFQNFYFIGKLVNKILNAIKSIKALMELMRGSRGSMWLICLWIYLVQVLYTWLFVGNCLYMGRLNTYSCGSSKHKRCLLGNDYVVLKLNM